MGHDRSVKLFVVNVGISGPNLIWTALVQHWTTRANLRLYSKMMTVVLVPYLATFPWASMKEVRARTGESVLLFGLAKQAVV